MHIESYSELKLLNKKRKKKEKEKIPRKIQSQNPRGRHTINELTEIFDAFFFASNDPYFRLRLLQKAAEGVVLTEYFAVWIPY